MNRDRDDGFTLVEVLVTLAILSLALTGFYVAISGALQTHWASADKARGLRHAHEMLERVGVDVPASAASGVLADGKHWRITVAPLAARPVDTGTLVISWVTVIVSDRRGREMVRLETARWAASP